VGDSIFGVVVDLTKVWRNLFFVAFAFRISLEMSGDAVGEISI